VSGPSGSDSRDQSRSGSGSPGPARTRPRPRSGPRPRLRLPLVPRAARWGLALAAAGLLFYFSLVPPPGSGAIPRGPLGVLPLSTWLHFAGYAGLAVAVAYAMTGSPRPDWQVVAVAFGAAVAYGVGIELVQATVPVREFSYADMGINALGAGIAAGAWRLLVRYARFYRARRPADLEPPVG